jgi:hypothetical protein
MNFSSLSEPPLRTGIFPPADWRFTESGSSDNGVLGKEEEAVGKLGLRIEIRPQHRISKLRTNKRLIGFVP